MPPMILGTFSSETISFSSLLSYNDRLALLVATVRIGKRCSLVPRVISSVNPRYWLMKLWKLRLVVVFAVQFVFVTLVSHQFAQSLQFFKEKALRVLCLFVCSSMTKYSKQALITCPLSQHLLLVQLQNNNVAFGQH